MYSPINRIVINFDSYKAQKIVKEQNSRISEWRNIPTHGLLIEHSFLKEDIYVRFNSDGKKLLKIQDVMSELRNAFFTKDGVFIYQKIELENGYAFWGASYGRVAIYESNKGIVVDTQNVWSIEDAEFEILTDFSTRMEKRQALSSAGYKE